MRAARLAARLLLALAALAAAPPALAQATGADAAPPGFLAVGEVVVPVAREGRLDGYVVVKAAIQFATPEVARRAEPWLPRIVDAWLRTVHGLAQRGHFDGASLDPELLKRQLLQATRDVLADESPREVLLATALFTRVN